MISLLNGVIVRFQDPHIPPYASCLFFELHKSNGVYHVEIFYKRNRGDDSEPLEALFIPDCGKKCPLNQFYKIYQDIIPVEDFETECRRVEISPITNEGKTVFSFAILYQF